jgi:hypothetical protein
VESVPLSPEDALKVKQLERSVWVVEDWDDDESADVSQVRLTATLGERTVVAAGPTRDIALANLAYAALYGIRTLPDGTRQRM